MAVTHLGWSHNEADIIGSGDTNVCGRPLCVNGDPSDPNMGTAKVVGDLLIGVTWFGIPGAAGTGSYHSTGVGTWDDWLDLLGSNRVLSVGFASVSTDMWNTYPTGEIVTDGSVSTPGVTAYAPSAGFNPDMTAATIAIRGASGYLSYASNTAITSGTSWTTPTVSIPPGGLGITILMLNNSTSTAKGYNVNLSETGASANGWSMGWNYRDNGWWDNCAYAYYENSSGASYSTMPTFAINSGYGGGGETAIGVSIAFGSTPTTYKRPKFRYDLIRTSTNRTMGVTGGGGGGVSPNVGGAGVPVGPIASAPPPKDIAGATAGVTDHGALTGLADDDHTQYLNTTRHDADDHSGTGFTKELLMQDGVTAPPVPIENEAQDDWLYQD